MWQGNREGSTSGVSLVYMYLINSDVSCLMYVFVYTNCTGKSLYSCLVSEACDILGIFNPINTLFRELPDISDHFLIINVLYLQWRQGWSFNIKSPTKIFNAAKLNWSLVQVTTMWMIINLYIVGQTWHRLATFGFIISHW